MILPKLILLDRDNTLIHSSANPESPLYYVTKTEHIVIKPGVVEAIQLIQAHDIHIALITKQRCVSKGLATRTQVDVVNNRVAHILNVNMVIYVEEAEPDKRKLLELIIERATVKPSEMAFFDDSPHEQSVAKILGIPSYDGSNLLESVKQVLQIS